jgi:hypothetical protein
VLADNTPFSLGAGVPNSSTLYRFLLHVWRNVPEAPMLATEGDIWRSAVTVPAEAEQLVFGFTDGPP